MRLVLAVSALSLAVFAQPIAVRAQCTLASQPTIVGRRASLEAPLVLTAHGDRTAVGWVVPADTAGRYDDSASVVLDASSRVASTLDREEPQPGGGQFLHPIFRVSPVVRAGALAVNVDSREDGEPDNSEVVCGAHRSLLTETRATRAGLIASYHIDATYHCRLVAPERPFVFGARAEHYGPGLLSGVIRLLAASDGASAMQPLSWQLALRGDRNATSFTALDVLTQRNALEGLSAVRVGDVGWFVVFRFGDALYGGWLGPSLAPLSALSRLTAPPLFVGIPSLATNGREVLIVHAARRAERDPWTLVAERVQPRAAPSAPQPIAVTAPRGAHVFAPSVAPLSSGWALSYTIGPLRGVVRGRDKQHLWLASLDAQLAPRSAPVRVTDAAGGSDGRVLSFGTRIQVAYMGGQDSYRSVRVASASCN